MLIDSMNTLVKRFLCSGLFFSTFAFLNATPTVNGLFYGDGDSGEYEVLAENEEGRGTLYYYLENNSLYMAVVVDPSVNDNVFDKFKETDYISSAGWSRGAGRTGYELVGSDHLEFSFTRTKNGVNETLSWHQDYVYDADGDGDPMEADWLSDAWGDDGSSKNGLLPPEGTISKSSLQWNLNNDSWVTNHPEYFDGGGRRAPWKSPHDPNDPNSLSGGYPFWDSVNQWEWALVYEMMIPLDGITGTMEFRVNSAHNSPSKDDNENVPIPISGTVSLTTITPKDFGDLPSPYPTVKADNGPYHELTSASNPTLGAFVDADMDGLPGAEASGDDNDNTENDEDGIEFTSKIAAGETATLTATANLSGYLNAWMDFNGDGDFDDTGEQIFTDQALSGGANNLNYSVPANVTQGVSYARFRFSSETGLSPTGGASDGEVEDYRVQVLSLEYADYGDAAEGWLPAGEAVDASYAYLGSSVDKEGVYTGTLTADDDDNSDIDDEDGVTFYSTEDAGATWSEMSEPLYFVRGARYKVQVDVTVAAGVNARLAAWFDFDGDGFDNGSPDLIIDNDVYKGSMAKSAISSLAKSNQTMAESREYTFTVPDVASADLTYVRFRLDTGYSSDPLSPSGYGDGFGEVEDYYAQLGDTDPVAVSLASFDAQLDNNAVILTWTSENEVDHAGYTVSRSESKTGPFKALFSGLITEPDSKQGALKSYAYTDSQVRSDKTYYYRLNAVDLSGGSQPFGPVKVTTTGIEQKIAVDQYWISDNYPNPFNPSTVIEYRLPEASFVHLEIYDINARLITTLVSQSQGSGRYRVEWDATNNAGASVSSGTYFYRFRAGDVTQNGSMIYMK
ncbi:MAG: GEVED domain-containing protein [candidate division KSB1 bacterium]|nr:GEVED domain-containing protein [candidate division KSB1 bacterium]